MKQKALLARIMPLSAWIFLGCTALLAVAIPVIVARIVILALRDGITLN